MGTVDMARERERAEERRRTETGSRIPSISTGGAAMNAIIKTEVAVNQVGIIKTPNHPM
jgi:hypothetical protein